MIIETIDNNTISIKTGTDTIVIEILPSKKAVLIGTNLKIIKAKSEK